MKIAIDARFYGTEHTGLGRYTINFLHSLANLTQAKKHDFYLLVRRRYLNLKLSPNFHLVEAEINHYSFKEQLFLPRLIAQIQPDLFHALHFNVPLFLKTPFIVTIHDLIKSHFSSKNTTTRPTPIFQLKRWGYQRVIHHALFSSYAVIVPSKTVKQDILRQYPSLSSSKIHPLYEAPDPLFLKSQIPNPKSQTQLNTPNYQLPTTSYILYVGNAYPHKNLPTLLQAFQLLLQDQPQLNLVVVSKQTPFLQKTLRQFPSLHSRIKIVSNLSDQELASLYQHAKLTLIPSLMEGFSLTGLESLSLGTPVVASDIPVHREIYGSAVFYAHPHSSQDFARQIKRALKHPPKGKLPRPYTWHNLAQSILNLYENYEKNSSCLRSVK